MVSENGLCKVSDKYFSDFPSIRHMSNKHEKRPHYLAVRHKTGIVWLIPLSSQVDKYEAKIQADEKKHKDSIFHYVARVKGKKSVFLIGNAIPVTDDYIVSPFTIQDIPYIVENEKDIKAIRSKFNRYLALVRIGKLQPAVDIMGIERVLLNRMRESDFII